MSIGVYSLQVPATLGLEQVQPLEADQANLQDTLDTYKYAGQLTRSYTVHADDGLILTRC